MTRQDLARRWPKAALFGAVAGLIAVAGMLAPALSAKPKTDQYGTKADVAYAKQLWDQLVEARLVGPQRINTYPFKGAAPHAPVQQVLRAEVKVDGHTGIAVVKANYRKKGAKLSEVYSTPARYLSDFAVMFRREAGYDTAAGNWFWALYQPNGRVIPYKGRPIAGRVGRESVHGCIGCHAKKGGQDLETLTIK